MGPGRLFQTAVHLRVERQRGQLPLLRQDERPAFDPDRSREMVYRHCGAVERQPDPRRIPRGWRDSDRNRRLYGTDSQTHRRTQGRRQVADRISHFFWTQALGIDINKRRRGPLLRGGLAVCKLMKAVRAEQKMQVIIQPRDGIEPFLEGIRKAEERIEIILYRLDRLEIEQELVAAAARGVHVHALITYTNKEGLKEIRKMEKRLMERGVNVTRTAEDLVRYHSKMMIIDRRMLYLLTFNFTFLDIHHSRSFGVITDKPYLIAEAVRLFEADVDGQSNRVEAEHFVISPLNSRRRLSEFIANAQKQLLIYDGKLSDSRMIRLLEYQADAGVELKVIGAMSRPALGVEVRDMPLIRLHAQAIIRDGCEVFFGSQSLRKVELDQRREVGLITRDAAAVRSFLVIFEMDWGDIIRDVAALETKLQTTQG